MQKWTKRFCDDRESLQDNDCVGRPSTLHTDEKVEEVCELIWSDWYLTVCEIAEECHTSCGSVQSILTEKFGNATETELRKITPADFQYCNTQREECWQHCINAGGEYFEGDH